MYPNGTNSNNINFISVYLENLNFKDLNSKTDLKVLFTIGIQRQGAKKDYMKIKLLDLKNFRPFEGFNRFMSHDELFDPINAFIFDGKFTLFSQVISIVVFISSIRF